MEEVDKIIIPILKQTGCPLPEKLESVSQFEAQHIYTSSIHVLHAIDGDKYKFPKALPDSQAGKFRICSTLSTCIKEMGYMNELGYEAFLYPNEKDMRTLLIWLVDKLPKLDKSEEAEEALGSGSTMVRDIKFALKDWTAAAWAPPPQQGWRHFRTAPLCVPTAIAQAPAETVEYWSRFQPLVNEQPRLPWMLPPSLFEHNIKELALSQERDRDWESPEHSEAQRQVALKELISSSFQASIHLAHRRPLTSSLSSITASMSSAYADDGKSAFARRAEFTQEKEAGGAQVVLESGSVSVVTESGDSEEERRRDQDQLRMDREQQLGALQQQIKEMQDLLHKMEERTEQHTTSLRQVEGDVGDLTVEVERLGDTYKVKKRTLDLLPNAEENLKKLQEIANASAARLLELAQEWEKHRVPLVQKYRRKKQLLNERKGEVGAKVEQIKRMRLEMKEKALDLRAKDDLLNQVTEEYNKLPKSINRQVYVKRIMDIVKNLEKQKIDIKKVLVDVRGVQKDINTVSQASKRSFDITDEVVFQVAKQKKDPTATQAYKYVVQLRQGFEELVKNVEVTGKCKNEIKDVEQQIEELESRNTNLNMKRVEDDLDQVQKENKKLMAKLKGEADPDDKPKPKPKAKA